MANVTERRFARNMHPPCSLLLGMQVTALEQRCQKLESEVQKLAQTWSEAAPTEEIKVNLCSIAQAQPTLWSM